MTPQGNKQRRDRGHQVLLGLCYLLGLAVVAYFAVTGFSYYTTPLIERPRHPMFWSLKPGGQLGHTFGVVGAAMMVLMLGYSLRKRLSPLQGLGPTSYWLDYHILLGICGPLFIILHSSFKVHGLVALSFWSMIAVALSGVVGRYLYRQIPRSRAGDELSLAEIEARDHELSRELTDRFDLAPEAIERLDALVQESVERERSLVSLLVRSWFHRRALRRRLREFRRDCEGIDPGLRTRFEEAVERKAQLRRRLLLWHRLQRFFHYWHVIHKPFAVIMYLFMVVHIAIAWMTGYAWGNH